MSFIDKGFLMNANLDTRDVKNAEGRSISFYNTDKNISVLYMKLTFAQKGEPQRELQKYDVAGYKINITAIKPKTNQYRVVEGVLSDDLMDESCAIWKFELDEEFTNQIGPVTCWTKIIDGDKVLNMNSFAYNVNADGLTGLNEEIVTNKDLPILEELIEKVQKVNNINDIKVSETETYSNKKIEEKFSGVDAQFNTVEQYYAKKSEVGQPTQEQVNNWFSNNPDATTTVQDNSITNSKLKDGVIYPTNMIGVRNGSNNIWQPIQYMQDVGVTGSTTLTLGTSVNGIVAIHKVNPNTKYQILKTSSDRFRVIGFLDKPTLGSATTEKYVYNDSSNTFTFTTGNVNYIAIHLTATNTLPTKINLFLGTGFTDFEEITYEIPFKQESIITKYIKDDAITPEKILGMESVKNNVYNPLKTMLNTAISGSGTFTLSTFANAITVIHKVNPNTKYQILKTISDRFRVVGFENEPILGVSTTEKYVYNDTSTSWSFTTNNNINYIAIHLTSANTLPDRINMYLGEGYTEFEAENDVKYKIPFADKSIPLKAINGEIGVSNKKYYLCNLPSLEYKTNTLYEEPIRNTAQTIYNRFDSMMNSNPNYITRELIGTDDNNLPIYIYHFFPVQCRDNYLDNKMPHILHVNGLHGHELHNVYEGLRFFEDLVYNWKTNSLLEVIRKQVKISYVPIASPWCYENNSRININGVDPNRNFKPRWFLNGEGTNYYSGTAPLTENNTKWLDEYIRVNADKFDFGFDHHNFNSIASDGFGTWYGYKNPTVGKIMFGLAGFSDSKLRKEYKYIDDEYPESNHLSKARYYLSQGTLAEQMEDYGIPSILFETVAWFGVTKFGASSNIDCKKYIVEILGNLYLAILKNINDF